MQTPPSPDITHLLLDWSQGNQAALDQLMPVVYQELRKIASSYLKGERSDHRDVLRENYAGVTWTFSR